MANKPIWLVHKLSYNCQVMLAWLNLQSLHHQGLHLAMIKPMIQPLMIPPTIPNSKIPSFRWGTFDDFFLGAEVWWSLSLLPRARRNPWGSQPCSVPELREGFLRLRRPLQVQMHRGAEFWFRGDWWLRSCWTMVNLMVAFIGRWFRLGVRDDAEYIKEIVVDNA